MELPITIVFEPPSRVELRALLRRRWTWIVATAGLALSFGIVVLVVSVSRAEARATLTSASLTLNSRPSGAEVWLDDHAVGRTPAVIGVAPGAHRVRFKAEGALDTEYAVDLGTVDPRFDALLWRRQPRITRLRASLPGAALDTVQLLPDGKVAQGLRLGADHALQAWLLDPSSGAERSLATDLAGARLAVAPDSAWIALIGRDIGPPVPGRQGDDVVIWLAHTFEPNAAASALWRAPTGDTLTDVSWTPDQQHLLAVSQHNQSIDAVRNRVWLIDRGTGTGRLLLNLPSRIVPGSASWSPDGRHVALLAHAGALNALCLLDLDGDFRYLADLEPGQREPLPLLPLSWSTDTRHLLFAAGRQEPVATSEGWLQEMPSRAIYGVELDSLSPTLIADADAQLAAAREDGQIVALTRARTGGNLELTTIDGGRGQLRLIELPLRPPDAYGAAWDMAHGSLLIAATAAEGVMYWLVRLRLEDGP